MEDRLLKLLDTEQLSSSKFADVIGVQRSSVSHILTGRNKPSFDFLQKTLKAFPMLNADWLILGEGEMYEGEHGPGGGNLFDLPSPSSMRKEAASGQTGEGRSAPDDSSTVPGANISEASGDGPEKSASQGELSATTGDQGSQHIRAAHPPSKDQALQNESLRSASSSKRVTRVILFYDDNSFEAYEQA